MKKDDLKKLRRKLKKKRKKIKNKIKENGHLKYLQEDPELCMFTQHYLRKRNLW